MINVKRITTVTAGFNFIVPEGPAPGDSGKSTHRKLFEIPYLCSPARGNWSWKINGRGKVVYITSKAPSLLL